MLRRPAALQVLSSSTSTLLHLSLSHSYLVSILLKISAPFKIAMDALLRQSRSMCPFLNKTSPATLRSLSTSTRHVSPGGGTISNLQILGRRCPVMGKAMAVQSARTGNTALNGVFGGVRSYGGKAKLHTSRAQHATVDTGVLRRDVDGMALNELALESTNLTSSSPTSSRPAPSGSCTERRCSSWP